jgi:group I intron endonuclease
MMAVVNYSVYRHVAPNGKSYVGITCRRPEERWSNGRAYKDNPHFWNAIQKYGWDNFTHEILQSGLTKEEACRHEIEYISEFLLTDPRYGYNRDNGGAVAGKHSEATCEKMRESWKTRPSATEETRRKLSEATCGNNNPFYGKTHSAESLKKMRLARLNMLDETRQKYRDAALRRPPDSEETRRRKSESHIGKKHDETTRRKMGNAHKRTVICVETGQVFEAVQSAALQIGVDRHSISACCSGKNKTCGGYHWKYLG